MRRTAANCPKATFAASASIDPDQSGAVTKYKFDYVKIRSCGLPAVCRPLPSEQLRQQLRNIRRCPARLIFAMQLCIVLESAMEFTAM